MAINIPFNPPSERQNPLPPNRPDNVKLPPINVPQKPDFGWQKQSKETRTFNMTADDLRRAGYTKEGDMWYDEYGPFKYEDPDSGEFLEPEWAPEGYTGKQDFEQPKDGSKQENFQYDASPKDLVMPIRNRLVEEAEDSPSSRYGRKTGLSGVHSGDGTSSAEDAYNGRISHTPTDREYGTGRRNGKSQTQLMNNRLVGESEDTPQGRLDEDGYNVPRRSNNPLNGIENGGYVEEGNGYTGKAPLPETGDSTGYQPWPLPPLGPYYDPEGGFWPAEWPDETYNIADGYNPSVNPSLYKAFEAMQRANSGAGARDAAMATLMALGMASNVLNPYRR